ncbi:CobW family GTP-binding protein [Capillimicrobium parvum]|uniref:P-loop guanosine triphosphatase YjiA n=1 Tax=Capillimicrobium parvum TaxID=2884022 RepID=A0A9E7C129_9ACTN|nr:GTP-binding protein [Capillimicrobium parvum]UGS37050.1 P-loop guanosine triphosphatase YjiA [Capillimicrobium parvum]
MGEPIAVSIVSGFLGAGKTTFLLDALRGDDTVVVLNEISDAMTELELFGDRPPRLLTGGCVCCDRAEELRALLRELAGRSRETPLAHVVIETTGLAHPERVAELLRDDPLLRHRTALREIVVVVDVLTVRRTLAAHREAVDQIAAADRVVLSKTDLCEPPEVAGAVALVRAVNPSAELVAPGPLPELPPAGPPLDVATEPGEHLSSVRTLTLRPGAPLSWPVFGVWLTMLLHAHGARVLRFKARVDAGGTGPVLLDAVQDVVHPPRHLAGWGSETPGSELTFVTRDLEVEQLERSLALFQDRLAVLVPDP